MSTPARRTLAAGLLQRRECILPTKRGLLALLLVVVLPLTLFLRHACHFLTVQESRPGGVLVFEGWISPDEAPVVLEEFKRHPYRGIYITGGPIEVNSPLASFGTYAHLSADVLRRAGGDPAQIHPIPGPLVGKDRTYSTAVALRKALLALDPAPTEINLMTGATHSRRSRLLYEMALRPNIAVGCLPLPERDFDPDHWWTTSAGFRAVTGELIAYLYARLIFRPLESSPASAGLL